MKSSIRKHVLRFMNDAGGIDDDMMTVRFDSDSSGGGLSVNLRMSDFGFGYGHS